MAYVREKSLEGNTVLNILYHDWKERTGGCLCCWFLGGKSNRNRVITPIFLCHSVAFPNRSVYLLNWCFLCYRGLPGLVIHHHLKELSSLRCVCLVWLGKQTLWNILFPFHSLCLSVCCGFFSLNVAVRQTLRSHGFKGAFQHKRCGSHRQISTSPLLPFETKLRSELTCQWVELPRLQVYTVKVYTVKSHFSGVQFNWYDLTS